MLSAPNFEYEETRLKTLLSYNILDTPAEPDFDAIARLAQSICEVPIALVIFVDHERQWFKAKCGLTISETSRDIAFCTHAIAKNEIFIVPDALADDRFFDNPLVVGEPNIRFYAGVPLLTRTKMPLGTLCVIDRVPRRLSLEQLQGLQSLGNQVINVLELRRLNGQLEKMVVARTEELETAHSKLKKASDARDAFLTVASHELKTPLSSLRLKLEFMSMKMKEEKEQTPWAEAVYGQLKQLEGEVDLMAQLMNLLLDITRVDQLKMNLQRENFDLAALLETLSLRLESGKPALNTSIILHKESRLPVMGLWDRKRLEESFTQLILNGLRQAPEHPLDLSVRATIRHAIVELRDQGPGLTPSEQDIMFNRLETASPRRDFMGLGLGMFMAAQIIKAHGGQIEIESEMGKGSIFRIQLPLSVS